MLKPERRNPETEQNPRRETPLLILSNTTCPSPGGEKEEGQVVQEGREKTFGPIWCPPPLLRPRHEMNRKKIRTEVIFLCKEACPTYNQNALLRQNAIA